MRKIYYNNDILFNCGVDRLRRKVIGKNLKTKILNAIINCYGLKEYKRIYGGGYYDEVVAVDKVCCPDRNLNNCGLLNKECDIIKNLSKNKIVTFDIFDTLLLRKCGNPENVFRLIENSKSDYAGFWGERVTAELRARNKYGSEITYDNIYDEISPKFKILKDVELEIESRMLYRNDFVYKIYKAAVDAKKHIYAISDMYLPSDWLKIILKREGYEEIEIVFVSGEYKKSKCHKGELFDIVAKKIDVSPSEILHIGDNKHSDYDMPKNRGLNAICIDGWRKRFLNLQNARFFTTDNTLALSLHNGIINYYNDNNGYFYKIGYMLGGPLVVGYLTWLKKEIKLSGADCVLFVARDGWILKKCFEKFFNDDNLKTGYVYLNRIIGLRAFATYLDDPGYLKIVLRRASKYLGTPAPKNNFDDNKEIFNSIKDKLIEWGSPLLEELRKHVFEEVGTSEKCVTVDMGTGRFSSLRFAKKILKDKMINSYFYLTVNNYHLSLVYQPMMSMVATAADIEVLNDKIDGGKVNLMELMEILVSSPEPRIIDIRQGKPVYDGYNDMKGFYNQIALGIENYVETYVENFPLSCMATFSVGEWMDYARAFVSKMNQEDFTNLACVNFCAAADNETDPHKPFSPSVKNV